MTVVFFDANLERLYRGSDVVRDLERRAIRVTAAAKLNATGIQVSGTPDPSVVLEQPVGWINAENRGPRQRTTALYQSIRFAPGADSDGVFVDVGSDINYSLFLETSLRNGSIYPFLVPALQQAKGG